MTSNKNHDLGCQCNGCVTNVFGRWVDSLGLLTSPGLWQLFLTITFSTPNYPWQRGFPKSGTGRPDPIFAHHLFDRLILHLEEAISSRVDYVVADQFGELNGRFHQHAIIAGEGLDRYSRTEIWRWLKERAGWSTVLPFEHGAAYYISRYIGRDARRCEWSLRVGARQLVDIQPALGGGL